MFALCPLAGRDRRHAHRDRGRSRISIHAPHAGRDLRAACIFLDGERFQSTRPMRGATSKYGTDTDYDIKFQSTRPARGATIKPVMRAAGVTYFNPRAPRGARQDCTATRLAQRHFNPRAPRGARPASFPLLRQLLDFNPRAPRGARRKLLLVGLNSMPFQSTRPARGATITSDRGREEQLHFNPRAPRGARLSSYSLPLLYRYDFNPRAPRGARQQNAKAMMFNQNISIHAPREGRDWETCAYTARYVIFQSTRPARGATY